MPPWQCSDTPPAQLVKAGGHSEEGYFVATKGLVLTL